MKTKLPGWQAFVESSSPKWGSNLFLLAFGSWLALCDCAVAQPPLPKDAKSQQIKERWSVVSRDELRTAAEAGIADAEFYHGISEINAADAESASRPAWTRRLFDSGKEFTEAEKKSFSEKWLALPEAEHLRAADSGDLGAIQAMIERNYAKKAARAQAGFEWVKKAAAQELVVAEEELAKRYLWLVTWVVIQKDEREGLKWLERAAEHGSEWSLHKLADFESSGRNGPPDPSAALEKLRQCADRNCPRAQYELAMFYASGDGVSRHAGDAPVELLRKSAGVGYNKGNAALADRYRSGLGVQKDLVRACGHYEAAIEADTRVDYDYRSKADWVLGLLDERYEPKSHPSPQVMHFANVLGCYFKATKRQDANAMVVIGRMYLQGADVPQDSVEAYEWFALAAEHGNATATIERDKLKLSLTTQDLERAERELKEYKSARRQNR